MTMLVEATVKSDICIAVVDRTCWTADIRRCRLLHYSRRRMFTNHEHIRVYKNFI